MKALLLSLIPALFATMGIPKGVTLPATDPIVLRADGAAADIAALVGELPEAERETYARLLFTWSGKESGWTTSAIGDAGKSVGILQVNVMWLGGHKVADVLKDRMLGLRIGLGVMRDAVKKCGSLRAGLGLYASGKCDGAPGLVHRRCALAGVQC